MESGPSTVSLTNTLQDIALNLPFSSKKRFQHKRSNAFAEKSKKPNDKPQQDFLLKDRQFQKLLLDKKVIYFPERDQFFSKNDFAVDTYCREQMTKRFVEAPDMIDMLNQAADKMDREHDL